MPPITLSDIPIIAWYIGVLVFLEGLLSADNALVLALMVRHLPKGEQRRVLRYGIWGAVAFRVVAVLLSALLLKLWYFKVIGGAYLLFLAIKHFLGGESASDSRRHGWDRTFWGTVVSITLADIAFSIDSIVAAVALADDFPARFGPNGKLGIVIVGGVLGIITMRLVVRYFVILLDRFPGLAYGAYVLVAWIGLKLVISGFHSGDFIGFQIHEWLFWSVMLAIGVLSFVIRPREKPPQMAESIQLLDEQEALLATEEENEDGATGSDPARDLVEAEKGRGESPGIGPTRASE